VRSGLPLLAGRVVAFRFPGTWQLTTARGPPLEVVVGQFEGCIDGVAITPGSDQFLRGLVHGTSLG